MLLGKEFAMLIHGIHQQGMEDDGTQLLLSAPMPLDARRAKRTRSSTSKAAPPSTQVCDRSWPEDASGIQHLGHYGMIGGPVRKAGVTGALRMA